MTEAVTSRPPLSTPSAHSHYYLPAHLQAALMQSAERHAGMMAEGGSGYAHYAPAIILPLRQLSIGLAGGVCDLQAHLLAGYVRSRGRAYVRNDDFIEIRRAYPPPAQLRRSAEEVIFGGALALHFGHFLLESTCRLWYVAAHRELTQRIAVVVYPWWGGELSEDLPSHITAFLELLGIDQERLLIVREPTLFAGVTVPQQDRFIYEGWDARRFARLYAAVCHALPAPSAAQPRIYLSRSRFVKQDIYGERYFEDFFAAQGFAIIHPQELSLTEQLSLLGGARTIASTLGTLSHLALWARPGTALICLLRSAFMHQSCIIQQHIDTLRQLEASFVATAANVLPVQHNHTTSFVIGPTKYWRDFARQIYALDIKEDIFSYLCRPELQLGEYLRDYFRGNQAFTDFQRNFDRRGYLEALYATFCPERLAALHAQLAAGQHRFANQNYILVNEQQQQLCMVRLADDARLQLLRGSLQFAVYTWAYDEFEARLHWYNAFLQPVLSFRVIDVHELDPGVAEGAACLLICSGQSHQLLLLPAPQGTG